ncbi:MAG: GH92 family glycosyl hydrolase [[Clostridium] spiroforme]|uniref:GH92 family glycosyl hydrolase n=1 Tax=Thomasclavelia spiroformis TaxID=29348 RepID=A0A943I372_9FIRM|nr:GH92 family glycosyl hydrolase [Thomasclavelia spiroformis]MBS5587272.1 GH92 family glycosyl hydrolase [Thomasclavelia spiroformis]
MNKNITRLLKGALAFIVAFSTMAITSPSRKVNAVEQEESYTQYVDPFVCTDVDYGQLFPGSVVPNGLVKLSPDTYPHNTLDHAGYDYSKLQIQGFSHTRIEGVGGQGAGGDVLVTPTYVEYSKRPQAKTRAMNYTKEDESAKPGYYSVELTPKTGKDNDVQDSPEVGKIKAEMTTDQRTGFHRYTFPKAGSVNIITDLNYTYHGTDIRNAYVDVLEQNDSTTAIGGRFSGRNVGGSGKYTMYFYMETSKPANSVKTWNDTTLSDKTSQKGNDIGTVMNFNVKENEEIQLKVSISPISVKQAEIDMHNEINDWDFDAAALRADQAWNDVLSKVRVESSEISDPTGELKQLFYTHLYHMFMTPVNATSTSGTFRGTDGKIHEANDYTHYDSWTLWDDYRKYPMIGLVQPDTYKDMVKSIANALDYGIVTWSHDKQPVPNVRTEHAVALLADGVAKGFTDIDNLEEAYREAIKIANKVVKDDIGYVPGRMDQTVEYAYDDWCLSIIADALGHEEGTEYFLDRSFNYKNLYKENADQETIDDVEKQFGLLISKNADGSWKNVDPRSYNGGLYQGTHWQYTWYLSNDVNGLMDLMGGKERMFDALSMLFGEHTDGKSIMHNAANEVELHAPYLFNFAGRPDRTQYWVRTIYTKETYNDNYTGSSNKPQKMYKLSPQGYLETMDDDAGTMAMMFVSAAMGIFPMTPGDTTFQIGSPFFEKITLDVGNGKTFTIEANNVSADNFYIQSATLNGKSFNRTWIDYSEITRGGTLSFEMGDTPSTWAQNGVTAKSSSDNADTSTYDDDEIAYSSAMFEESKANNGSFDQKIVITLKTKEFAGEIGEDLVATGKINITNVPEGLKASAIKTETNKVEVSLNGKAKNHTLNDSISNLTIEITDKATNEAITDSIRKTKDNVKVMFIDNQLTYSQSKFKESKSDDGAILETSTITLTGDATFTGEVEEDFVVTGKVQINNVPEGLTAKMIKIDDHTVVLSFEGKAVKHDADVEIELAFANSAFNGALASEIDQSSRGGMTALLLDFDYDHTSKLRRTMAEATYINANAYTQSSYQLVLDAVAKGQALLDKENATSKEIDLAIGDIIDAQEQLAIPRDGFSILQAESSDATSGGSLKVEGSVLHGTYDGAWIRYDALDFNGLSPRYLELRYDNASNRCASDSHLEVRLDGIDGTLIGDVQLPATGTAWGSYETVQVKISNPELLDGKHDVYFVFKGTTGDKPYVAKVDYLQFKETADIDSVKLEAEKSDENSGNGLKNEAINLGGTYDGAWIKYNNVNFNNLEADTINVRYSTRVDACALDARIEIRKDDKDGELLGTIMLPLTGGWSDYQTVTADLDTNINGIQDICFVLRGTNDGRRPYVANIDYMEFVNSGVNHIEAENKADWSGAELKVENSTDNTGKSLTNIGGARNNAWLRYNGVDFNGKTEMTVRYSHNPGSAGTNSRIDVYLDNMDGNPIGTVNLPTTNGWANYTVSKAVFDQEITGSHDVYLKLHTDGSGWVANFDWFEFGKPTAKVDKSQLQAKYEENVALLQDYDKYHYVGFNIFKDKLLSGSAIIDKENATANDVRIAIKDIDNALATLQYKIAFDLNDYVEQLKDINQANYTKDSYVNLMEAIEIAKAIPNDSEYEVFKKAYDGLVDAHAKLTALNRTALEEIIKQAEAIDLDLYKEEGKAEFKAALENAKTVYETVSLTQAQVDEAVANLDQAIKALKPIETDSVNKVALKIAVDLANAITDEDLANVVPAVVDEFIAARDEANAVYNDVSATQEEVDNAFDRLASVMQKLEFFKGDKKALKAFIDKVSGLDSSKYTQTTWTAFDKELTEAIAVYNYENAMQEEVNTAYSELVTAFLNLRLIPDKSLLEDLINQANGLNGANYTKATFDGLTKALDEAKAVYENPDATQEEVDNAKDVLAKAIAGLQTVTTDNTVSTPVNNGDTTASVKTGDESLAGMFATIALLSIAGYTILKRKEN